MPAFTGLGAPWWEAEARGTLFGMSRGTTRAHIARAALDAIALQCADVLVAMQLEDILCDFGCVQPERGMRVSSGVLLVAAQRVT